MSQDDRRDPVGTDRAATEGARDRALWLRARGKRRSEIRTAEIDPMLMAAYLDGRLDDVDAARLEARLAVDDEALTTLISVRQSLAQPVLPAPGPVVARAKAMVRAPARPMRRRTSERFAWFLRPAAWTAAVSVSVALGILSFQLGQTGYERFALQGPAESRLFAAADDLDTLSWRLLDLL